MNADRIFYAIQCLLILFLAGCNDGVTLCTSGGCQSGSSSGGSGSSSSSSSSGGSSSSSSGSGGPTGGGTGVNFTGSLSPNSVAVSQTAMVQVLIRNGDATDATGVSTSISFSSSLDINVPPSQNCHPSTNQPTTSASGSTVTITLSGATVPASSSCQLSVTVSARAAGSYPIDAGGQTLTLTVH